MRSKTGDLIGYEVDVAKEARPRIWASKVELVADRFGDGIIPALLRRQVRLHHRRP